MSEKELMIAMAIGDGCVTKGGSLQLTNSVKQEEYFFYKRNLLIENGIKCLKIHTYEPSGFGKNKTLRTSTSATFKGKELRKYLYPNGIKIIPNDLEITPFMWSIIYQDDGRQNKISHYNKFINGEKTRIDVDPWVNRYTLYTDSFDENSIQNLKSSLKSYGIESAISYSNKNKYPHIHIRKKESKTLFRNLILPFIHESMMYKLNLPTHIIQK